MSLPDFRNLGVLLRTMVLAEGLLFVVVLCCEPVMRVGLATFVSVNVVAIPALLTACLALFLLSPSLAAFPYRIGVTLIVSVAAITATLIVGAFGTLLEDDLSLDQPRVIMIAALLAAAILWYFNWRHHVLSPALSEARLIALQARIRPHFLFNSLNTVLGLIRSEPKRAERVLENLAELYRALLSEAGTLVPLARELDLARGYAEIEMMRLGERLKVDWQCQDSALDALVPPLMLQPLLENAVYHGVEPSESGGEVNVSIFLKGDQLNLVMRNPCLSPTRRHGGNRMALNNIRERLALHFDAEAEMSSFKSGDEFVVQIRMPYKHVSH